MKTKRGIFDEKTWEYLEFWDNFGNANAIHTLTTIFRAWVFQSNVVITCVCRKISDRTAGYMFDLTQNFFSLVNIFVQNSTAVAVYVYVFTCSVCVNVCVCIYIYILLRLWGFSLYSRRVLSCEACIRHYELKMFTPLLW